MPMAAFCSVLCFITVLSSAAASWMDGDDGVDRPFGDLPDMPIVLNHTQPVSACARLCQNNSQCASWAYSKAGCGDSTTPYCYLKGAIPDQSYNPCRVGKRNRSTVCDLSFFLQVSGVKNASLQPPAFRPLSLGAVQPSGINNMHGIYRNSARIPCI